MSIFHTFFNVGLLVILFKILKNESRQVALTYLITRLLSTFLLALGAATLLTTIPVSQQFLGIEKQHTDVFNGIISTLAECNAGAYQIGMMSWGISGLCLCSLLHRYRGFSVVFSIFGVAAYLLFMTGTFLELAGYSVGVICSIPGGLFEIGLSILAIIKGNRAFDTK
ncbi:MAG: DUF4386 domain-containing protein [Bacteroidota bacterium]